MGPCGIGWGVPLNFPEKIAYEKPEEKSYGKCTATAKVSEASPRLTSSQSKLAKGLIAVLSPFAAANAFVRRVR